MTTGVFPFELDLMQAVLSQLIPALDAMESAELTLERTSALTEAQGIYLLLYENMVCYVGKTDAEAGLKTRLSRHVRKFEHRRNVAPSDIQFKAAQIYVFTAMDIETKLINHYDPRWDRSGFGSNDPGRNRETTNKPELGFDAQFPIDIDIPIILPSGLMTVHEALMSLKNTLPYTLRYEVTLPAGRKEVNAHDYRLNPHQDMLTSQVTLPEDRITVRNALRLITSSLPTGWQATYFVSHVILYKENLTYVHGTPI